MVVGAVTPTLIEKDEPFMNKQGMDLAEPDVQRRVAHLIESLLRCVILFLIQYSSNSNESPYSVDSNTRKCAATLSASRFG